MLSASPMIAPAAQHPQRPACRRTAAQAKHAADQDATAPAVYRCMHCVRPRYSSRYIHQQGADEALSSSSSRSSRSSSSSGSSGSRRPSGKPRPAFDVAMTWHIVLCLPGPARRGEAAAWGRGRACAFVVRGRTEMCRLLANALPGSRATSSGACSMQYMQCSGCHHSVGLRPRDGPGSSDDVGASTWLQCSALPLQPLLYGIHGIRCHCVLQPGTSSIHTVLAAGGV
jgi:hypothetical protein